MDETLSEIRELRGAIIRKVV